MEIPTALKLEIKQLLIEKLMLQITAEEIGDEQPLFGPGASGWIRWMRYSLSWSLKKSSA